MSRTAESATTQPIRRRTIAKGMAWSVPAITVAAPAASAAVSGLPPCVVDMNAGLGSWAVGGVAYPGTSCGRNYHCDARPEFRIEACDEDVIVRVTNVSGKSRWCWAGSGPVWAQEKTQPANTTGTLTFAAQGDVVGPSGGFGNPNQCTIVNVGGTDDGIHVNVCSGTVDQIKFEMWYGSIAGPAAVTGYFTVTRASSTAPCQSTWRRA